MKYGDDYKRIPATSKQNGKGIEVLPDLYMFTVQIVNLFFIGYPKTTKFVIIDAGTPSKSEEIIEAATKRFGSNAKPEAIILTHGHFDHVGSIIELVQHWNVPVYAHELEMPYLTGEKSYPKPDFTVQGGMVAKMSPLFPIAPIEIETQVMALPANGEVPYLSEFKWIHVPGHSPGQIALFRENDRTLIAADTFVTVKQENLYKVMTQKQEISGPPRYLTTDWKAAKRSVQILEKLKPICAVTGHGLPMGGELLRENLGKLVREFDDIALPTHGKYI
ncbi:MBL fold metallo-hydrolase [Carnobacterium sp.]|uniref:MBL fold metallo-hydrolase n=1 Tax=Carnobacterium sp. TaxID=48221 RepID=UPI003890785D